MRRLGAVAIAIAGLMVVAQGVYFITFPISILTYGGPPQGNIVLLVGVSLIPLAAAIALGGWLIAGRNRLAERLFEDAPLDLSLESVALLRLGLILIAVTLIITGIASLAGQLAQPLLQAALERARFGEVSGAEAWTLVLPGLVLPIARSALGVALLSGSHRIAHRLWMGRPLPRSDGPRCPACGAPYDPADYRDDSVRRCIECNGPLPSPRGDQALPADSALDR